MLIFMRTRSLALTLIIQISLQLLAASGLEAQSFFKTISTVEDEVCWNALELPDGGYLLLLQRGSSYSYDDPARFQHRDIILKIDQTGNLIDSIEFPDPDTSLMYLQQLIRYEDKIIITGILLSPEVYGRKEALRIIQMDYALNILSDTIFANPMYYLDPAIPRINHNGNLVFVCTYTDKTTEEKTNSLVEISPTGTVIKQVYQSLLLPTHSVIDLPAMSGYHVCDISRIVAFDYDFNFISQLYEHQTPNDSTLVNQVGHKCISDSSYVLTGQLSEILPPNAGFFYDCGFAVFDMNGNWESQHRFGSPYRNDYPQSFDFLITNEIYFSVFNPADVNGSGDNRIGLFCISLNGTEIWSHWYGGYGFIRPGAVVANIDSTCTLIANFWDIHAKPYPEYDIVIMKLNRDGTITPTQISSEKKVNIYVYPDPGKDYLNVKGVSTRCELSLFDNAGRLVFSKTLESNNATINVCELLPGFYTYCIDSKNKTIAYGKWVKTK